MLLLSNVKKKVFRQLTLIKLSSILDLNMIFALLSVLSCIQITRGDFVVKPLDTVSLKAQGYTSNAAVKVLTKQAEELTEKTTRTSHPPPVSSSVGHYSLGPHR